jgi:hypothetical protein
MGAKTTERAPEMSDSEVRDYRVQAPTGEFYTIRMRAKRRCTEDGVEGIIFGMLHPNTSIEIGEYWAPLASVVSNPGLDALLQGKE